MTPRGFVTAVVVLVGVVSAPALLARQTAKPTTQPAKPATTAAKVQLPAAIAAAFHTAYPTAEIKNVSKEKEGGKDVYEVESVDKGRRRDVTFAADGTVLSLEEELTEADLPAAVVTAVKTRYPKATMTTVEVLIEAKTQQYEIQLKGAPVKEAVLTLDGKWISPKVK